MRIICKRSDLIDNDWELSEHENGVRCYGNVQQEDGVLGIIMVGTENGDDLIVDIKYDGDHLDECLSMIKKTGVTFTVA